MPNWLLIKTDFSRDALCPVGGIPVIELPLPEHTHENPLGVAQGASATVQQP
jgi:hypothetical protein